MSTEPANEIVRGSLYSGVFPVTELGLPVVKEIKSTTIVETPAGPLPVTLTHQFAAGDVYIGTQISQIADTIIDQLPASPAEKAVAKEVVAVVTSSTTSLALTARSM